MDRYATQFLLILTFVPYRGPYSSHYRRLNTPAKLCNVRDKLQHYVDIAESWLRESPQRTDLAWILSLLSGIAVGVIGSRFFTWFFNQLESNSTTPYQRLDILLKIAGALVGLALLWATLRRVRAVELSAAASARQASVSERAEITTQFTNAIKQLGDSESPYVRIGGIYSLEKIMLDHEQRFHHVGTEILAAFIRGEHRIGELEADAKAALEVLLRRIQSVESGPIDLSGTLYMFHDFSRLHLRNLNFSYAQFIACSFLSTTLENTSFANASFEESTNFQHSHLKHVIFDKARMKGLSFYAAALHATSFRCAHIDGCKFGLSRLENVNFSSATVSNAYFGPCSLARVRFFGANLEGAKFHESANIHGADFRSANLNSCIGLTKEALAETSGDEFTSVAKELRPSHWPAYEGDVAASQWRAYQYNEHSQTS